MNVCICAIAKCENLYIKEWVDYHLNLGFDHIYLYDNNEIDGERISEVIDDDRVTIVNYRGRHQLSCETQVKAYNECYRTYAVDYDWIMFIDIDEFLTLNDHDNIKDFLEQPWCRKANAIRFHWLCYSDSGNLHYEDVPVLDRFTELCSNNDVNKYYKQIYRTNISKFKMMNVHYCDYITGIKYPDGSDARYVLQTTDPNIRHDVGYVRHYVTKSLDEFIDIKYKRRGKGSSKTRLNKEFYFRYNELTDEKSEYFDNYFQELLSGEKNPTSSVTSPSIKSKPNIQNTAPAKPTEQPKQVQETVAASTPAPKPKPRPSVGNADYFTPQERAICPGAKRVNNPAIKHSFTQVEKVEAAYNAVRKSNTVKKPENTFGISICISAWHTEKYIEECLDSIAAQDWFKANDNWEIIVGIDGCQTTLAKMKGIMYKYKNLRVFMMDKNVGTYITCNTIMKEAAYDWILRFDSDDRMYPNMVSEVMLAVEKEGADMIKYRQDRFSDKDKVVDTDCFAEGSICIKKSVLLKYGGYMPWRMSGDSELRTRLRKVIKIHNIQKSLYNLRVDNSNKLTLSKDLGMKSQKRAEHKHYIDTVSESKPILDEMVTTSCREVFLYQDLPSEWLYDNDRIIVSFTSWRKRIWNCAHIVDLMLNQTKKPYKIVLNLSSDEFPKGEKDLPKELVNKQGDIFEIYWVRKNTKTHKRILPTLNRYPNDLVLSIDDDIEYPNNFIEKMYERYIYNGKSAPVTGGGELCRWENGLYSHCGAFSLVKKEYFGDYLEDLYDNVVISEDIDGLCSDSLLYTYAALLNGKKYTFGLDGLDMEFLQGRSDINKRHAFSETCIDNTERCHKAFRDYIFNTYGKTYDNLLDRDIVVNITTWVKRDWCLYSMLKNLKKQTLYPNRIVLWLCREEYNDKNLPRTIRKCIDEKLLTDIMWVEKNTKGHKRYNCFKYYNDCYNVLLDDDILYRETFIEDIYNEAKKHQDCLTVYSSRGCDYHGLKFVETKLHEEPSHKNMFMAGCSCFPPFVFPFDAYLNENMRNEYVLNCDESWYRPHFIKHGVKVNAVNTFNSRMYPTLNESQNDSLWNLNKRVVSNGMRDKERNFYNAIKITHTEKLCKELWPDMGIDGYRISK